MTQGSTNRHDRVTLLFDGPVAEVRLSRPDKHNALDERMFEALSVAGAQLASRADLRAVVLSGEEPSFCAGLDLKHFGPKIAEGIFDDLGERSHEDANLFQHVALIWRDLRVPVIAALQGSVFGGGLQIALGADIRYAAPDARLSIMETRWGLVPDMAGMVLLRHLVRDDLVRELVYSARVVPAAEARELGLVTRVCDDPRAEALSLAHQLAAQSPRAVQAAKRLINDMADLDRAALLKRESDEQAPLLGGPDQIEAMRAQAERRPPEYAD